MTTKSKYRFILIPPFHLPDEDQYRIPAHSLLVGAEKEKRLLNNKFVLPHLEVSIGICIREPLRSTATGRWKTREEFAYATTARMELDR